MEDSTKKSTDSWTPVPRYLRSIFNDERPITVDEASSIRLLLFGNTGLSFSPSWRIQGFRFRNFPPYVITQKQPGPCGVIASVQAYVMYELLFGRWRACAPEDILYPQPDERKEALARAISSILWQAGDDDTAIVARKGDKVILNDSITTTMLDKDGTLEFVKLKYFRSFENLCNYFCNCISESMRDGACILFLYSLLLTHGIDKIKEEMDETASSNSWLIGEEDAYCSQEIVNLILIGKAVTNLFNGDMELDSGGEETSHHRGIHKQSKIGLLSMYDYQDAAAVGTFYKNPKYPIWVLSEDSHFTVLFAKSLDILHNLEEFELCYIDCLARRNVKVYFSLKTRRKKKPEKKCKKLFPSFQCILSKWPSVFIEVEEEYR